MIEPTIGRVVWIRNRPGVRYHPEPEKGDIAYVHKDGTINVGGLDHKGNAFQLTCIPLFQGEGEAPAGPYAEWMPYQKGQAAKTEKLEKAVKEGSTKP